MEEENKRYDYVEDVEISKEMRTAFLDYSMSVIVSRALPDVRDGMKPVHRRILHAMNQLGITSGVAHKKSARIVGEVIGTVWCFIREMAGSGYDGKSTEGKLSVLDLSEAKIVEGGDYYNKYYYYENDVYYYKNCYTSNDVIGKCAFKGCSGLTSLTLPDGITEIGG